MNPEEEVKSVAPVVPEVPTVPELPEKGSGYGKRPLWQWVLIYLVIAVVVYGLIYYFFFAGKGTVGY